MTADIRIRSYGATQTFGFQPLSAKGETWIRAVCQPLGGQWVEKPNDRCFWIEDWQILKDTLRHSDLVVVAGDGPTTAHDHPADPWLGRMERRTSSR